MSNGTKAARNDRAPVETRLFGARDLGTEGLLSGWAEPEFEHVWNNGLEATQQLNLHVTKETVRLNLECTPFIEGGCQVQNVTLFVNGFRIKFWRLNEKKVYRLGAEVSPEFLFYRDERTILNCVWHLPCSTSPSGVGVGDDTRQLGLCFRSITVS